jgi:hypothetical protein
MDNPILDILDEDLRYMVLDMSHQDKYTLILLTQLIRKIQELHEAVDDLDIPRRSWGP